MRDSTLLLALVTSAVTTYLLGGAYLALSVLFIGGFVYIISLKPSLGGPLFYGLIGYLGGFLIALILGNTICRNSRIGSYLLLSLIIIGPALALWIGRRTNYRLWYSLKP